MSDGLGSDGPGSDGLIEVRIIRIPVPLYREASQHHEDLRREFALVASHAEGGHGSGVPARLLALIADLNVRFQAFTADPLQHLEAAAARDEETIDLTYRVPPEVGPAAAEFDALLDEADDYCRAGETLLTLATPASALAFRRWFLGEFVRQAAGKPPRPWTA